VKCERGVYSFLRGLDSVFFSGRQRKRAEFDNLPPLVAERLTHFVEILRRTQNNRLFIQTSKILWWQQTGKDACRLIVISGRWVKAADKHRDRYHEHAVQSAAMTFHLLEELLCLRRQPSLALQQLVAARWIRKASCFVVASLADFDSFRTTCTHKTLQSCVKIFHLATSSRLNPDVISHPAGRVGQ